MPAMTTKDTRRRMEVRLSETMDDHLESCAKMLGVPRAQVMSMSLVWFALEMTRLRGGARVEALASLAKEFSARLHEAQASGEVSQ